MENILQVFNYQLGNFMTLIFRIYFIHFVTIMISNILLCERYYFALILVKHVVYIVTYGVLERKFLENLLYRLC